MGYLSSKIQFNLNFLNTSAIGRDVSVSLPSGPLTETTCCPITRIDTSAIIRDVISHMHSNVM